mgnify:CR=1 FL=1
MVKRREYTDSLMVLFMSANDMNSSTAAMTVSMIVIENMGFSIVFADTATDNQINYLKQRITTAPYVSSMRYFSAADAMNKWKEDTGEDLMQVLGVNPFSPELEVKVKAGYADVDSIGPTHSNAAMAGPTGMPADSYAVANTGNILTRITRTTSSEIASMDNG